MLKLLLIKVIQLVIVNYFFNFCQCFKRHFNKEPNAADSIHLPLLRLLWHI